MFRNVLVLLLFPLLFTSFEASTGEGMQSWKVADNWPRYHNFGQISAVSVDTAGNIYVFHRGNHVWDYTTFSDNNYYQHRNLGPIKEETMIVLDSESGSVKKKTGAKMFYMPHGLTVDYMDNIWVTDVALHQVFKFSPLNISSENGVLHKPEIILGHAFEPGNDNYHFCKPTDVAIDNLTGDFYVSDGYCNSRIIKYDKFGKKLLIWGRSSFSTMGAYTLNVPHALSIATDENLLFVADRENCRGLAYSTKTGTFEAVFQENRKVYSVAYSTLGGKYLFTLSNSSTQSQGVVTVYDIKAKSVVQTFSPPSGFSNPHDIVVSSDGKCCYVVELSPNTIWKFHLQSSIDTRSQNKEEKFGEVSAAEISNLIGKSDSGDPDKATHDFLGGTILAIGVVSFVILITFLIFVFHVYKKKAGYAQYEMRRLILEDEEEVGINVS